MSADKCPRTRKELMQLAWENHNCSIEVAKEGPFYVFIVPGFVCATRIRCIDSFSVSEWVKMYRAKLEETQPA